MRSQMQRCCHRLLLVAALLCAGTPWLHNGGSLVLGLKFSDFVIATAIDSPHSEALVAASAQCREGIRLYVATNASIYLSNPHNEFWGYYPDEPELAPLAPADSRAAQAPWLAFNYYGLTFKWMLYGDDDTVFFIDKVMDMVKGLDPQQPYFLSDSFWWSPDTGRKADAEPADLRMRAAPHCVPCGFTARSGGVRVELPEGCPCNTTVLCEADQEGVFAPGTNCTTDPRLGEGVPLLPFHGGAGAVISIGLLRKIPYKTLRSCVWSTRLRGGGADAVLTHCLWALGYGITDPGYRLVHPGFQRFDTKPGDLEGVLTCLEVPKAKASKSCLQRVRAQVSVHVHADGLGGPAAAADFAKRLCDVYGQHMGRHADEL